MTNQQNSCHNLFDKSSFYLSESKETSFKPVNTFIVFFLIPQVVFFPFFFLKRTKEDVQIHDADHGFETIHA